MNPPSQHPTIRSHLSILIARLMILYGKLFRVLTVFFLPGYSAMLSNEIIYESVYATNINQNLHIFSRICPCAYMALRCKGSETVTRSQTTVNAVPNWIIFYRKQSTQVFRACSANATVVSSTIIVVVIGGREGEKLDLIKSVRISFRLCLRRWLKHIS